MDPRYLNPDKSDLGAVDYVVFVLMLVSSLAIGAFYAWRDRNNQNNQVRVSLWSSNIRALVITQMQVRGQLQKDHLHCRVYMYMCTC